MAKPKRKGSDAVESKRALKVLEALKRRGWTDKEILEFAFEVLDDGKQKKRLGGHRSAKPNN